MPVTSTIIIILAILMSILIGYHLGQKIAIIRRDKHWQSELINQRKDAIVRSRAVLAGHFSEQLSPFLPNFPFNPSECKFLGKPIDFLVFQGMDKKEIDNIVFVEVKSGNSKLSPQEKKLKDAIESKRVSWQEYRVPEGLTKRDDNIYEVD